MGDNVTDTRPVRKTISLFTVEVRSTLKPHLKYELDKESGPNVARVRERITSGSRNPIHTTVTIGGVEFDMVIQSITGNADLTFTGLLANGNRLVEATGNLDGNDRHVSVKEVSRKKADS